MHRIIAILIGVFVLLSRIIAEEGSSAPVITSVNFERKPLRAVVESLSELSREADPSGPGSNILLLTRGALVHTPITLSQEKASLDELLRLVAGQAGCIVRKDEHAYCLLLPGDRSRRKPTIDPDAADYVRKLGAVVLPKVDFSGSTLHAAVQFLSLKFRQLHPNADTVSIRVDFPETANPHEAALFIAAPVPDDPLSTAPLVTLTGFNMSFPDILGYICEADGHHLHFAKGGIVISSGEGSLMARAEKIILPQYAVENVTISKAVQTLQATAKKHDPTQKGVPIDLRLPGPGKKKITLSLRDVPVSEVITYIQHLAGLECTSTESAVVLHSPQKSPAQRKSLCARSIDIYKEMKSGKIPSLEALPRPGEAAIARVLKDADEPGFYAALAGMANGSEWLSRGLKKFPNSPALLTAAVEKEPNQKKKDTLIQKFKAADPRNALPWILAAQQAATKKKPGECLAELREAVARPLLRVDEAHVAASLTVLFIADGYKPHDAESYSLTAVNRPFLMPPIQLTRELQKQRTEAEDADEDAKVDEIDRLAWGMSEIFSKSEVKRSLIGELVCHALARQALTPLPADKRQDYLPKLPSELLADIKERTDAMSKVIGFDSPPDNPTDLSHYSFIAREYIRLFHIDGEFKAATWLKSQFPDEK